MMKEYLVCDAIEGQGKVVLCYVITSVWETGIAEHDKSVKPWVVVAGKGI